MTWRCSAVALVGVLAAVSCALAIAVVAAGLYQGRLNRANDRIRTLEGQMAVLCSRTVVVGVTLQPAGIKERTDRGC